MTMDRRTALTRLAATGLGFAGLGLALEHGRFARASAREVQRRAAEYGYGPLVSDPAGIIDLPEGFRATVFSRTGEAMDDGLKVPAMHDGMAAFKGPDGKTILIRNHEVSGRKASAGPFGEGHGLVAKVEVAKLYDRGTETPCLGGTTTLVFDTKAQKLERHWLSLGGTLRNCAGGPTPWGSWISCEETVDRAGGALTKDHGFAFEVPARADGALVQALPLTAMGRFNREAIAIDPRTGIVYQTEDREDGLLYRFIPKVPGKLAEGGRLQALALVEQPAADTRGWHPGFQVPRNAPVRVRWIDLDQPLAPEDDLRRRGHAAGAALFARGEGMWTGEGAIWFTATTGGSAKRGQIWRLLPGVAEAADQIELYLEPNDPGVLDYPDNMTVAPNGELFICEDGKGDQFVVGCTPAGELFPFAKNHLNQSELAGGTFSPDGTTFFVNIQTPGLTLAITGPFRHLG